MKTREMLKTLPEPYATQAVAEFDRQVICTPDEVETQADALMYGFVWSDTAKDQGWIYWSDFYDSLETEEA